MNSRHEYSFEKLRVAGCAGIGQRRLRDNIKVSATGEIRLNQPVQSSSDFGSGEFGRRLHRQSHKDQAHFSEIAYGSLMELACLPILCQDIGVLSEDGEKNLQYSIEEVSVQLNALHRSQRARM
jgi:23S rRNA-intervening sequence protein